MPSRFTRRILDVDVTRPSTPAGLTANAISATRIDLSWSAATDPSTTGQSTSGVAGYRVYRDNVLRASPTGLTYSDTGLTEYTQYAYQVASVDAAGNESLRSSAVNRRTLDATAPSAPTISASATGQTTATVSVSVVSTDSGTGVASYALERKPSSGSTWSVLSSNAAFPYSDTGLTAGTAYDWRARATDGQGNVGAYSATSSATTQSAVGSIAFTSSTFTENLTQNTSNSVDLDSRLSQGAPAAGWAYEGTLPTGISFNAATGVLSGTPTVIQAPAVRFAASNVSREEAEWALRSTASGVLWATRFDTDTEVYGPEPNLADSSPVFYRAYHMKPDQSPGPNSFITKEVGAGVAGRNALRIRYPASWPSNPGSWRRMFIDGQQRWPYDTPLYIAYTFRPTAASLAIAPPNNWKISLFAGYGKSGWGSTAQGAELATFHDIGTFSNYANTIVHYTNSGNQGAISDGNFSPNIRFQNMIDRGAAITDPNRRYCLYDQYIDVLAGGACRKMRSDVWNSIYFRMVCRSDGAIDFQSSVQYEGETQWTLLYDYAPWTGSGWGLQNVSGFNCFNTLTLTLQMTGRSSTAASDIQLDFSDIIVSTSPITPRTVWT